MSKSRIEYDLMQTVIKPEQQQGYYLQDFTSIPGPASYNEKFTKIDNEKHIKEVEVVEGGYLDFGFKLFRVRFEVIEKGEDSSIIKSTLEYEAKEEANASLVSIDPLANIVQVAKNYLGKKQGCKRCKIVTIYFKVIRE
ncbi:norbelladine synthase [Lathyrus oleraceus]|uniref:Bet v I/Major latex protein domain-containing protein n=1 Tax=Pisum sativum TaxID=3888 RepID=A0A9D4VWG1_PEA|nr:norbelladine synthase-like [Pisum sativum]KAI5390926.1 hypothetical protein KIW84_075971 [Pisum sativum]